MEDLLDAAAAAQYLGVSKPTLYAYVSRGLVESAPGPGPSRARRYPRSSLDRFRDGKGTRAGRIAAARESLYWGLPVVDSALTLIRSGRLFYRGQDATVLAEHAGIEQVATLLWTGQAEPPEVERWFTDLPHRRVRRASGDPGRALMDALLRAARDTPVRVAGPRPSLLAHAARLMATLYGAAGATGDGGLGERLARGWGSPGQRPAIEAALILCADHELNTSSLAARVVASTDGTLEDALLAALAALHGRRHGGATWSQRQLFDDAAAHGAVAAMRRALAERDADLGFGHPLYPAGDPRGAMLCKLAEAHSPDPLRQELLAAAAEFRLAPNLDFGLVALGRALELPDDAPFLLFALGRIAGWVAHVIETVDDGRLIRPRARYVGSTPGD